MQTLRQDNIPKMIVSGATSVLLDTVNGVFISFNTGSAAGFLMSGDVELTSKPTWAY